MDLNYIQVFARKEDAAALIRERRVDVSRGSMSSAGEAVVVPVQQGPPALLTKFFCEGHFHLDTFEKSMEIAGYNRVLLNEHDQRILPEAEVRVIEERYGMIFLRVAGGNSAEVDYLYDKTYEEIKEAGGVPEWAKEI